MTTKDTETSTEPASGVDLPDGQITEEALEDLRRLTGLQMRPERYIREASIDTVTNFCNGIGDLNPLHRDEEYAKWTRWGGILAPSCFLYARTWPGRTRFGLPGVHGFHAGNRLPLRASGPPRRPHRQRRAHDRLRREGEPLLSASSSSSTSKPPSRTSTAS